jgi:pheromone shutdown protein TraB
VKHKWSQREGGPAEYRSNSSHPRNIVVVAGIGHISGLQRLLEQGGVSDASMLEICSFGEQSRFNSWRGHGVFSILKRDALQHLKTK